MEAEVGANGHSRSDWRQGVQCQMTEVVMHVDTRWRTRQRRQSANNRSAANAQMCPTCVRQGDKGCQASN
eukprot:scaffold676089_cov57-Prasinocladus_malaysianus.AAC.1